MERKQTITEIEESYDQEWVLLEDPEVDEYQRVLGGKVVFHSKDRDEIDQKAIELKLRSSATVFTGEWPDRVYLLNY